MAKQPRLSTASRREIREATRGGLVLPAQEARVRLVAEAIARVDRAAMRGGVEGTRIDEIPDYAVLEALRLEAGGGISQAVEGASSSVRERLERVSLSLGESCAPVSCQAEYVCRTDGRFAPKACVSDTPHRVQIGAFAGWRGADTAITYETPSGTGRIAAFYALVPVQAAIASNDPTQGFAPSPGYPSALQERDYAGSEVEQQKVRRAADPQQFKPRLLISDNEDALTGPPILDARGFVLGGNGRTMIAQLSLAKYGGDAYAKALRRELSCSLCYGLRGAPTEGTLLVRVLTGKYDPVSISALLNATLTAVSGREAAMVSLGNRIPVPVLDMLADAIDERGSYAAAVDSLGERLVRSLSEAGIITPSNRPEWLSSVRGTYQLKFSRAGKDSLRDALIGALIRDVPALREAPPSLLKLYEYVSPMGLVIERWDAKQVTGYNWIPILRDVADEASRTVLLSDQEFAQRYAERSLFGEVEGAEVIGAGPEAVIVLAWVRSAVKQPAVVARSLAEYFKAIPPEARAAATGGSMLFGRSPEELADEGLDPSNLRASVLGMATLADVQRAGGPRSFLAGRRVQEQPAKPLQPPVAAPEIKRLPEIERREPEIGIGRFEEEQFKQLEPKPEEQKTRRRRRPLRRMPGLGPGLEAKLEALRITTLEELAESLRPDRRYLIEEIDGVGQGRIQAWIDELRPEFPWVDIPTEERPPLRDVKAEAQAAWDEKRRFCEDIAQEVIGDYPADLAGQKQAMGRAATLLQSAYTMLPAEEQRESEIDAIRMDLDEALHEMPTSARFDALRGQARAQVAEACFYEDPEYVRENLLAALVDRLPGGDGDEVPRGAIDPRQLQRGLKEELEHTDDPQIASEIARDHLSVDPGYYERLHEAEQAPEWIRWRVRDGIGLFEYEGMRSHQPYEVALEDFVFVVEGDGRLSLDQVTQIEKDAPWQTRRRGRVWPASILPAVRLVDGSQIPLVRPPPQASKAQASSKPLGERMLGEVAHAPRQIEQLRSGAEALQVQVKELRGGIATSRATPKRIEQWAHAERKAEKLERISQGMQAIADGLELGTLPESLRCFANRAQVDTLLSSEKRPLLWVSPNHARALLELTRGYHGIGAIREELEREVRHTERGWIEIRQELLPELKKFIAAAKRASKKADGDGKYAIEGVAEVVRAHDRMAKACLDTPDEYLAARTDLLRLIGIGRRPEVPAEREIVQLERQAEIRGIPGFFPTPEPLRERMLALADISVDDTVLEPSAGAGDLADAIAEDTGRKPYVIERNQFLRRILEKKGYELLGDDFLEHELEAAPWGARGGYDVILQNPPFEKRSDIDHVRKAYAMLRPGGRLVSIMSLGPFQAEDGKSVAFRTWLDTLQQQGASVWSEDNPAGSFEPSTSVATRMLLIDKPDR